MIASAARDRLIVALDMPTRDGAQRLVSALGNAVGFYKVGLELLFDGGLDLAAELKQLGKRVFLDLKLLDIGNTIERAVANATELGVDFLTVHGQDRKTLRAAALGRGASRLKLLAVTVLTNMTEADIEEQGSQLRPGDLALRRARLAQEAGFDGVVASGQEARDIREAVGRGMIIVTPGIRLLGQRADDQERIMTPGSAIAAGADYLVVGRPITEAEDPARTAANFIQHIETADAGATAERS